MVTDKTHLEHFGGRPRADRAVFDAIADPTRRAILDGLSGRSRAAGEIAADFDISRPAVSKHLRALEGAGLVKVNKEGRKRMYEIDAEPLREVDRWMQRYRTMWAARLVAIKQHVESRAGSAGSGGSASGASDSGASSSGVSPTGQSTDQSADQATNQTGSGGTKGAS